MKDDKQFISGVVEGFYGRPWSFGQRKELFARMASWGLNTYLYAPKDDLKHRLNWRTVYTPEEEEKLRSVIHSAKSNGVTFVYSISPGLDMMYSSEDDLNALWTKMRQVSRLGCKAFALLFDDIVPVLLPSDEAKFASVAQAHAYVANEIFKRLHKPMFMFCPTAYCASRALPNVASCEYLLTVGFSLHSDIEVMWTGEKVIADHLSVASLQELSRVIQRKPLIWDNIHANDYDEHRTFLGPYCGRPLELYSTISGIMSNPNCEFESNYVPLLTLGAWVGTAQHLGSSAALLTRMAPSFDETSELTNALRAWLCEFNKSKPASIRSYAKANSHVIAVHGQSVLTSQPFSMVKEECADAVGMEVGYVSTEFDQDHLAVLVDFMYLPYRLGARARTMLDEFSWLRENISLEGAVVGVYVERLLAKCQLLDEAFNKFCGVPNEALLYDLYPYFWVAHEWSPPLTPPSPSGGACALVDEEAWGSAYIGGFMSAVQSQLAVSSSNLFVQKPPPIPTSDVLTCRSYTSTDKAALMGLLDLTELAAYDWLVGPYEHLYPEHFIVLEDSTGVCGFVACCPNNHSFYSRYHVEWLPLYTQCYGSASSQPVRSVFTAVQDWFPANTSHCLVRMSARTVSSPSVRRTLYTAYSLLRLLGSLATYVEVRKDDCTYELLLQVGSYKMQESANGTVILGRLL